MLFQLNCDKESKTSSMGPLLFFRVWIECLISESNWMLDFCRGSERDVDLLVGVACGGSTGRTLPLFTCNESWRESIPMAPDGAASGVLIPNSSADVLGVGGLQGLELFQAHMTLKALTVLGFGVGMGACESFSLSAARVERERS
jgi:hypothetical protein